MSHSAHSYGYISTFFCLCNTPLSLSEQVGPVRCFPLHCLCHLWSKAWLLLSFLIYILYIHIIYIHIYIYIQQWHVKAVVSSAFGQCRDLYLSCTEFIYLSSHAEGRGKTCFHPIAVRCLDVCSFFKCHSTNKAVCVLLA